MLGTDNRIIQLRRLRVAKGHTQQSLAIHSGISRKHISQIECGKADPTIGVLLRLAAALEVEVEDLLGERLPDPLVRSKWPKSRYRLRMFREVVSGDPGEAKQPKIGDLAVQPNQHRKNRYLLKVGGDWMEAELQRGDLVLVDNAAEARHGDIIACTINGKSTLRRYERKCKCENKDKCKCKSAVIVLKADNPSYDPIVVTRVDMFTIHGVALEIVRRKLR